MYFLPLHWGSEVSAFINALSSVIGVFVLGFVLWWFFPKQKKNLFSLYAGSQYKKYSAGEQADWLKIPFHVPGTWWDEDFIGDTPQTS